MKVCHVVQWLELGGGESVAVDLVERQRARGDQTCVLVLSPDAGPLSARLTGRTLHLPRLRAGLDPTLWPAVWARLARLRPDVVHTHDPKSLVYAAPAARLAGARVIHTKHGLDVDTERRRRLVRLASCSLHACVAVSAETAAAARAECAPEKVRHIPNGIDVDRPRADRAAARAALGLPVEAFVIGAVGRLETVKGHDLLLAAAAGLDAVVCLVGDGTQRAALAAAGPHVHFAGLRPDAAHLMAAFDVFVQPSRSEGLPLAVLEAMAAARPIIATAVGELPTVLAGVGLLVPPGDVVALRTALRQLRDDPGQRQILGAAAQARVRRDYSIAATLTAYDAVYRER